MKVFSRKLDDMTYKCELHCIAVVVVVVVVVGLLCRGDECLSEAWR